jgi:hypothetical protein
MAISVRKTSLWRREVDNKPGMLARTLQPLADAGADLEIVMSYSMGNKAAIEVAPISGKRATATAENAGLAESRVPAVVVTGDNRAGIGHAFARALGDAGINIDFLVAHVVGSRFSSVFGFESEADADRAIPLIKNAATARRTKAASARMPVARA